MTRTLLAFGDSHTAGAEILNKYDHQCYELAYPSYIAKYYGLEYKNYSQAGCGNDWLLLKFNQVIKKVIDNKENVIVLFNFCEASRTHIEVPLPPESQRNWDDEFYGTLHFTPQHLSKNYFLNSELIPFNKTLKKYLPIYRNYLIKNDNKKLEEKSLKQIFIVQQICKKFNIPFIFHVSCQWYSGIWSLISKENFYGHKKDCYHINDAINQSNLNSFWGLAQSHPRWKHLKEQYRWQEHYPKEYHEYWAKLLIHFINEKKILQDYH